MSLPNDPTEGIQDLHGVPVDGGRRHPAAPYAVVTCVLDTDAYIRDSSGATQELLGMPAAQLVGVSFMSLTRREDRLSVEAALTAARAGRPQAMCIELQRASGVGSTVSLSLAAMHMGDDSTNVQVLISSVPNMAERDLRQQRAYRMEIVGRLATGLAHDLNNRLLVIAGRSRFALDELPETSPVRPHLQEVQRAAERASSLTRQLLAFGRRQETAARWLSVNDIIMGMDTLLDRLADDRVTLTLQLDPGLWPVVIDQVQIEQMIIHLVLNGKDAMPDTGTLTISTCNVRVPTEALRTPAELPHGDYVQLVIQDTGRGMDAATLLRAFDPFFTMQNMTERSGLGLTFVYAIVQQARGILDVDSTPGTGTSVAVYLPRAVSATRTHTMPSREVPNGLRAMDERPEASKTILVVDDEAAVRTLIRLVLEGRGFRVLDARHGPDALLLAEIQHTPIDLLITDVAMSEMNGVDLATRLREQFTHLQVLFISGYAAETLVAQESIAATERIVHKPFELSTLLGAVGEMLGMELRT